MLVLSAAQKNETKKLDAKMQASALTKINSLFGHQVSGKNREQTATDHVAAGACRRPLAFCLSLTLANKLTSQLIDRRAPGPLTPLESRAAERRRCANGNDAIG